MRLGQFAVMRYAPMIGRPTGPRRLAVQTWSRNLAEALQAATVWLDYYRHQGTPAALWVERRGQPATRRRPRA